jgi:hypothetical protein
MDEVLVKSEGTRSDQAPNACSRQRQLTVHALFRLSHDSHIDWYQEIFVQCLPRLM